MPKGVHGNHARGPRHGRWNGGRTISVDGYVRVFVGKDHPLADPNGYAYEHRVVASVMLGRYLTRGEPIHHRNGDKTDNRPENLEVTRPGDHARAHNEKRGRDRSGRFLPSGGVA